VEHSFLDTLQKPLESLRDKRVLPVDRIKLKGLTLRRDGLETKLERKGPKWFVAGTLRTLANTDSVESVLEKLDGLRATRFIADGLEGLGDYGLDATARSVEIDAGAKETLLLGPACGDHDEEIYAARKGAASAILCVKEEAIVSLFPADERLRETRLLPLEADDVQRIVIETGGKKLAVGRDGEAWRVREPAEHPADEDVVTQWIEGLGAFRATRFIPLNEFGQGFLKPARVTVQGRGEEFTLAFGVTVGRNRFVRRNDESATMLVHAEVSENLSADPLAFRKRRLLEFSRYDVQRIVAKGPYDEEAKKGERDGWRLVKPAGLAGDDSVIGSVVGALGELRAREFVADKPTPTHGLSRPSRELIVTVNPPPHVHDHEGDEEDAEKDEEAEKPKVHKLRIGKSLADKSCYARLDGKGPVFVLEDTACRTLRSLLVARRLFQLEEDKIVGFTLSRGSEEIVLEKRGPDWHRVGGDKLRSAQIEDLLGVIRDARARDVAAYEDGDIAAPRLRLTVRTDGLPEQTLVVGKPSADGLEARIAGRGVRYILDEGIAESLEGLTF
jgi:hypothetical protein